MRVNIDANLRNADWTKRTWDLPTTLDAFLAAVHDVEHFMTLPAAQAMPPALRAALERRERQP